MTRRYCDAGACRNLAIYVAKYSMPYGTPASVAACSAEHRRVIAKSLKLEGSTWFKLAQVPAPSGSFGQMLRQHVAIQMGDIELWGD